MSAWEIGVGIWLGFVLCTTTVMLVAIVVEIAKDRRRRQP